MKKFNADKVYFISDTHFFHKNIITYCDRPFSSVEEMNEQLIYNWNTIVSEDDDVIICGQIPTAKARGLALKNNVLWT